MKYVIAKVMKGHWHFCCSRVRWSVEVDDAELFKSIKDAQVAIELLPDDDELDAVILPVELKIKY